VNWRNPSIDATNSDLFGANTEQSDLKLSQRDLEGKEQCSKNVSEGVDESKKVPFMEQLHRLMLKLERTSEPDPQKP